VINHGSGLTGVGVALDLAWRIQSTIGNWAISSFLG